MFDPWNAPGLRFTGYISTEGVNGENPLPVFEPVEPKDRPSINTLEGWNALREEIKKKNKGE